MRVLIVEDDKLMRWTLCKSMEKWGFECQMASNGREGVEKAEECRFDIVLLDYQLPDMNGLQVARKLREFQPRVVVFLVTAVQWSDLSVDAGLIDGYFNKPVDLLALGRSMGALQRGVGGLADQDLLT